MYIQRLGRTAVAGATPRSILLLAPCDSHFLRDLRELSITPSDADNSELGTMALEPIAKELSLALEGVDERKKVRAYHVWLMAYQRRMKDLGWDKARLQQEGQMFLRAVGWTRAEPPAV